MNRFLIFFSVAMVLIWASSSPIYAQGKGPFPTYQCDAGNGQALQTKIDNLPAGATLFIGGNCIGPIVISKDIHLRGFRSTRTTLSAAGDGSAVVIINFPAHVVLSRLDVDGGGTGAGVIANVGVAVKFDDVEVREAQLGLFLGHASAADIFDSTFTNNQQGIRVLQNSSAMIRRSTFDGGNINNGACISVVEMSSIALLDEPPGNMIKNCSLGLFTSNGFVFSHGTRYAGNVTDVVCGPGGVIDAPEPQIIAYPPAVVDIQPECRVINPLF